MKKSLYVNSQLCFGVPNPNKAQAKVIFDWVIANGANGLESWAYGEYWRYFGVDDEGDTYWSDDLSFYAKNILTFAEFAELAGVEVVE